MEDLGGRFAWLPNGQRVLIENVKDGLATVRRLEGERKGSVAVCKVSMLELTEIYEKPHEGELYEVEICPWCTMPGYYENGYCTFCHNGG